MEPAEIFIGAMFALVVFLPMLLLRPSTKRKGNPEHRVW